MIDREQPLVEPGKTVDSPCPRPLSAFRRARAGKHHPTGFTLLELLVVLALLGTIAVLVVANLDHVEYNASDTVTRATMQNMREAIMGSAAAPGYIADMKHVPDFNSAVMRVHDLLASDPASTADPYVDRIPPPFDTYNPVTNRGWRGPYLVHKSMVWNIETSRNGGFPAADDRRFVGDKTFEERGFAFTARTKSAYGETNEAAIGDTWGNPIVLQVPDFSGADDAKRFRFARLVSAGRDGILSTPLDDPLAGWPVEADGPQRGDDLVLFLNRADVYEDL